MEFDIFRSTLHKVGLSRHRHVLPSKRSRTFSNPDLMMELSEDSKPSMPSSAFDSDGDGDQPDLDSALFLPLTVSIDDEGAQLSTAQKNTPAQLSIPRELISEGKSSRLLQAELLRPVFAGTYLDDPAAYLVRLQLHLSLGSGQSWLNRIRTADIHVLLEDAPRDKRPDMRDDAGDGDADSDEDSDEDDVEEELLHPAIVKAFPGPSGWEGAPQSAEVTTANAASVQLGHELASVSYNVNKSRTRVETGAVKVKVAHRGPDQNILHVRVEEDAVDKKGVPDHLVVPFIIIHRSRRFRMQLAVHARYGLWRGKPADLVPILGRADEPLYFDPLVMRRIMDKGRRGINGEKVIEWRGALEEVNLQDYSSLVTEKAAQT
ncbi:hypothetical protein NLU13_2882 [Sarocladium strictum]|uniref:Uncharacterized protein n=1 Tax=Sarocladium strictum TaxID=5046 RepID=A0AA39GNN4_SARSR|nr:hypothetical protein NLU13_2882 [Sarocladium strictum]